MDWETAFSDRINRIDRIEDDVRINPFALFNRMSFSHIIEFLKMAEPMMRTFYAFEAIRGSWSVRALRRKIDSQYYQCVGWAKDPHKLAALAQGRAEKLDAKDFIKQDTVLEFIGLKPQGDWDEADLEKSMVDNLKTFHCRPIRTNANSMTSRKTSFLNETVSYPLSA